MYRRTSREGPGTPVSVQHTWTLDETLETCCVPFDVELGLLSRATTRTVRLKFVDSTTTLTVLPQEPPILRPPGGTGGS